ncbi:hypothetical protein RSPO_c02076 [Ralstonia solanacearum Po82]|uniref:Uncharacterized protein n=1 Tax=Ralstonia solanacearum (strain Po82) TaxID=1031711 RepID=F6G219_RALS8|nr:hypothetical protein RSPO_c02076 [Ralstonia solanacearum Po82]
MGIHRVERLVIARARHVPSRLKVSVPPRLRGMLNMCCCPPGPGARRPFGLAPKHSGYCPLKGRRSELIRCQSAPQGQFLPSPWGRLLHRTAATDDRRPARIDSPGGWAAGWLRLAPRLGF